MNEDDFNRHVEFMLHWQAQFAADLDSFKERDRVVNAQLLKLHDDLLVLRDASNTALDNTRQIGELMTRTFEAMEKRDARSERRLDRLERIVFRHVQDPQAHERA